MKRFQPHAFGFVGAVAHPYKAAQAPDACGRSGKTIHDRIPNRQPGFTPGGLFVDAAQPFGNNALILLFLVPDRTLGFVHHLVGADNPVFTQAQEIAEK
jgi:hypothetical protein